MWKSAYQLPLEEGARYCPIVSELFYEAEVKTSRSGNYCGLYTKVKIPAGSAVLRDGGKVLTSVQDVPQKYKGYQVVIGENLFLSPADMENKDKASFLNHSCEPNLERVGGLIYLAKCLILPGEELTIDYAPLTAGLSFWSLTCLCGAPSCRKTITGNDWQNPGLAKKLWRDWPPFIQKALIVKGIV